MIYSTWYRKHERLDLQQGLKPSDKEKGTIEVLDPQKANANSSSDTKSHAYYNEGLKRDMMQKSTTKWNSNKP